MTDEERRNHRRDVPPEGGYDVFITRTTTPPLLGSKGRARKNNKGTSNDLTLLLLIVLLGVSDSLPCKQDSECPPNRICRNKGTLDVVQNISLDNNTNSDNGIGDCVCREGTIAWKWRCLSSEKSLGDSCRVSPQCKKPLLCDPLRRKCVCETELRPSGVHPEPDMAATADNNSSTVLPLDFLHEEAKALNDAQLRTLLYIGLSLSVVILLGLLSFAYRKMIQEKKQSQAAIKGLLELISENQSLNSFCSSSTISDETVRVACDGRNLGNPYSISDKLHLPPLEGDFSPRFPSPHLSTPILPPIKKPSLASFPSMTP